MKQKIISIAVLSVILFFSVFAWIKPADDFSYSERRELRKFPEISANTIFSGAFMKNFESYTLDQFPFRESFRKIKAYTELDVFNKQTNNGIFYENGYIGKTEYPLNESSLKYASGRFLNIYNMYLKDTKTNIYFSIIPDKNYYLLKDNSDYLTLDYDSLVETLKTDNSYMKYIDIFPLLDESCYYKTDSHWKQEKIIPVAEKLASQMGVKLNTEFKENTLTKSFYGVYYGQSALNLNSDELKYLTNDTFENVEVFDFQNDKAISIYDFSKGEGKDPYEFFLSGSLSLIEINNKNATTEKELIIFRDSFTSSLAPLLVNSYKKITLIDIRYIQPTLLEQFIKFDNQDVLFIYSTSVLNNSNTLR